MKKYSCKQLRCFFARLSVAGLVVVLAVIVPTITIVSFNELYLYNKFMGNISQVQGVLEIWNVDSFDAGFYSKSRFLEKVSVKFSNSYQGVHFLVHSYTPQEAQALWEQGKRPAILSFGAGCMGDIEPDMAPITLLEGNSPTAVPWCLGGYALYSRTSYLQSAGISSYTSLTDILFTAGYTKQNKQSTLKVASLGYANNGYVCPEWVISQHATLPFQTNEIYEHVQSLTAYEAYVGFMNHAYSIFLGTQRDAVRLESRIQAGKLDDCLIEGVNGVQPLVQYISIVKAEEAVESVCSLFIQFLLSNSVQQNLQHLGMFSPTLTNVYNQQENPLLYVLEQSVPRNKTYLPAFLNKNEFDSYKNALTKNHA